MVLTLETGGFIMTEDESGLESGGVEEDDFDPVDPAYAELVGKMLDALTPRPPIKDDETIYKRR